MAATLPRRMGTRSHCRSSTKVLGAGARDSNSGFNGTYIEYSARPSLAYWSVVTEGAYRTTSVDASRHARACAYARVLNGFGRFDLGFRSSLDAMTWGMQRLHAAPARFSRPSFDIVSQARKSVEGVSTPQTRASAPRERMYGLTRLYRQM
jgi:hypothetical protein